ncbi:hypothetical protein [Desulfogranum mediterraneum]|uniref:hypothetical protein n=1 Tax=Desulfogranum mediterraneum TaxID=160661 RepID=UPI00041189B0|nr:hypothetical protein [Desulfogranum mediterraneum]
MNAISDHELCQKRLAAHGRIMAGLSHEMKNHLGIIRESNGLVEDLLGPAGQELSTCCLIPSLSQVDEGPVVAGG